METASERRIAIVEILIQRGANVNHQANDGRTAVMVAASCGNLEVVKLLLANGAATDLMDSQGQTALHIAQANGYTDVVYELIRHQGAFWKGQSEVMESLVGVGEESGARNHNDQR